MTINSYNVHTYIRYVGRNVKMIEYKSVRQVHFKRRENTKCRKYDTLSLSTAYKISNVVNMHECTYISKVLLGGSRENAR